MTRSANLAIENLLTRSGANYTWQAPQDLTILRLDGEISFAFPGPLASGQFVQIFCNAWLCPSQPTFDPSPAAYFTGPPCPWPDWVNFTPVQPLRPGTTQLGAALIPGGLFTVNRKAWAPTLVAFDRKPKVLMKSGWWIALHIDAGDANLDPGVTNPPVPVDAEGSATITWKLV